MNLSVTKCRRKGDRAFLAVLMAVLIATYFLGYYAGRMS